eukprot:1139846-Pelagomonas_calceolata.AAC.3
MGDAPLLNLQADRLTGTGGLGVTPSKQAGKLVSRHKESGSCSPITVADRDASFCRACLEAAERVIGWLLRLIEGLHKGLV